MEFDKSRVYTAVNADELRAGDKVIVASTIAELKRIITGEIYCIAHIMRINDEDCENRFCIGESNATGDITYPLAYLVERKENCTNCDMGEMDEDDWIGCSPDKIGKEDVAKTWCCDNWKPKTEDKWCKNCGVEVCSRAGVDADVRCPAWQPKAEQKAEHKCETCKYVNCGFKDFNTKNECDRWEEEVKVEKKCKDCGNAIDEEGKYCSGDEKHHWVDQTGEQKCWRPKAEQKAEMPELISLGNGQYAERKHYRPFRDTDELIKAWIAKRMVTYPDLCMPHIWVRQKECSKGGLLITYFGEDEVKTDMGFMTMNKLLSDYTFTDGSPCGVEE